MMRLHKLIALLFTLTLLSIPGVVNIAQTDPTMIRFLNMSINDSDFVTFYINDVAIATNGTPYTVAEGVGTTYFAFRSANVDFSVRDSATGDVLATLEDFMIESERVLSLVYWQPITADAPILEMIDETEMIADPRNEGVVTLALNASIPIDLDVTINGEPFILNESGFSTVGLARGIHDLQLRVDGAQLNQYRDLGFAIFPETESELVLAEFERIFDTEIRPDVLEYVFDSQINLSANQSVFAFIQFDVNPLNPIAGFTNQVVSSATNYIYALGVTDEGSIAVGDEISGELPSAGIRHGYTFTPTETRTYTIELISDEPPAPPVGFGPALEDLANNQYDPMLIVAADGAVVAALNDVFVEGEVSGSDAILTVELTAGVTYTIQATSSADISAGRYILRLQ